MKKKLFFISILVVAVSILVSCSINSSSETVFNTDISTTAVMDRQGTTHYYEPITDDNGKILITDKNQGVYAEIETNADSKALTKKNGTYITKEYTTILTINEETTIPNNSEKPSGSINPTAEKLSETTKSNAADNDINFKPSNPTSDISEKNTTDSTSNIVTTDNSKESTSNTTSPSKIVTDKDGWIDKWY